MYAQTCGLPTALPYFCRKLNRMKRIAIFASGTGSNARAIVEHFADIPQAEVALVLSNKPTAKVLEMAQGYGIATRTFSREEFYSSEIVADELEALGADLLVLAGFLWLVPSYLVERFRGKIVNIHPALLPKFGGKGMYGSNVHKAVVASGEKESGPTIHYVNEQFDEGEIIFQARCPVLPNDTPEALAARVLKLEHAHFPRVVAELLGV